MKTVAIHQPEHMPWLGFFHKVSMADLFVILDNVQFSKNYFQNRNKIRTASGATWITVPVAKKSGPLIKDIKISDKALNWRKKYCASIFYSYSKSKYFAEYFSGLSDIIMNGNCSLCELNTALLEKLFEFLNIETPVIRASEINPDGAGSPLILDICLKTECKIYLSGISGKDYLVLDDFSRQGIRVDFQEFHHPVYNQMYEPFMPCMSVMDLLFNYGDKSLDVIHGKGVTVMGKLFE